MNDPVWYPWRGAIAEKLLAVDYVRWDRFVSFSNVLRIYGWVDREDEHADFVVLDLYLYPGPRVDPSVMTSSAERSEELTAAILGKSEEIGDHAGCERVEDHFGTLADLNVVRLEDER